MWPRSRVDNFVQRHVVAWELTMAALTLVYVVAAFIEDRAAATAVTVVTVALGAVFLTEFTVRLVDARSRLRYLREHWLDLVTCIPMIGSLRVFRLFRLVGLVRLLITSRRVAAQRAKRHSAEEDVRAGVWILPPTLILLWVGSAGGFWLLEHGVNPRVNNFGDALFLSFLTATTVGYSSVKPVTVEGQILAGLVVFVGLGLLGFVSARLTAYWLKENSDSARMEGEVKALKAEVKDLKGLLERALTLLEGGKAESNAEVEIKEPRPG